MSSESTSQDGQEARGASVRSVHAEAGVGMKADAEHPVGEIVRIALPAVVTMLSYVIMQFVDMLVVSRLGPDALAAVGNGGIAAFVMGSVVFGALGVINTYASQNIGAGHPRRAGAYAWAGLWITLLSWVFIMFPAAFFFEEISGAMRSLLNLSIDPGVRVMEGQYGRVLLVGMVFTIAARGVGHFFYGVHRASTVMVAAITGNLINIPLSIGLVYGYWGLPEMGVRGAAWGTVVGSTIEIVMLMIVFLSRRFDAEFNTRGSWRFSGSHLRDIWRIGWPGGVQMGNELLCWWVFMSGLVANFGVAHNAAAWITLRYMHVSFMPAVGLSMAVTAVVGKKVGAGLPDVAAARAWLGLRIAMIYMGACALAFLLFRHQLVGLFVTEEGVGGVRVDPAEVIRIGGMTLILAAAFQLFDAIAIIFIGALRGAGDTVWPGVVTAITSWIFIVGGGYLAVWLWPEGGSIGPWVAASLYIIGLAILLLVRFQSGKWRSMAVVETGPAIPPEAGAGVVPEVVPRD